MPPLTEAQQRRVCALLAAGKLHREAGHDGLPTLERIHQFRDEDPTFRAAYERARNDWGDALAVELIEIADQPHPVEEQRDTNYRDVEGNLTYSAHTTIVKDSVERSKLRVAVRQFVLLNVVGKQQITDMNNKPKIIEGMVNDLPLSEDDAAAIKVLPPARA